MFRFRKKAEEQPASESASPVYALITEDEPILRMNASAMLEDMGFTVLGAESGLDALALMESNTVELLITDIHMPGPLDGLALAQAASQRWPSVRIVICSGRTQGVGARLPEGATFVPKPYTIEDIENAILSF